MRRFAVSLALIAMTAVANAEGPAPTFPAPAFKEGEERMGQPSRIVAPDYPPVARMEKRGGTVEITGRVSPFGVLDDAKVTAVPPADEEFAAAVRDVLEYWFFYVPTGDDCQPDPKPVTIRVEFSAEDGKPHVGVVRLASPKVESPAHFKPTRRVEPRFPARALNEGVAGSVYARLEVDARGEVSDVKAQAYSVRRASAGVLRSMESETRSALLAWRYPPPPEGKPWVGCYVINFRFRD